MSRYLITGATGMLGSDLVSALNGRAVTPLSRADLDITNLDAVRVAVVGHDVVFNAAAYTKVDDAESHEEQAHAVNALGARNLAIAAGETGATLIQISTDYVFDGSATEPYSEATPLNPLSAYGRTKADGERFVLEENLQRFYIVRTAWLYGTHGPNFARTMLRLITDRDTVSVVNDQYGQPTWTADLAAQLVRLADSDAPSGIYHGTNAGIASWFDFAQAVFMVAGIDPDRVVPTDSSQFVRPAPRPAYSVLGHAAWSRAGIEPLRNWRDALYDSANSGLLEKPW